MSNMSKQSPSRPTLTVIEAQLFVADMQRTCDCYTKKLALARSSLTAIRRFTAKFAAITRLNLRLIAEPVFAVTYAGKKACSPPPSPSPAQAKSSGSSWITSIVESDSIER